MPTWKLNLFVRVIKYRMKEEQLTAEQVLNTYPALTEEEKTTILGAINNE